MVDIDRFYISQVKKEAKLYTVLLQLKKERLKRCWISRIQKNNPWLRCSKQSRVILFLLGNVKNG